MYPFKKNNKQCKLWLEENLLTISISISSMSYMPVDLHYKVQSGVEQIELSLSTTVAILQKHSNGDVHMYPGPRNYATAVSVCIIFF